MDSRRGRGLAHVDRVAENAERRIERFDRPRVSQLAQIPDENLFVVPAKPNAGVLDRLAVFGRFREQIAADRLRGVDDFGEAVVVFGGLDEQLIEVAGRWRWIGIAGVRLEQDREQNRREERALVAGFSGGIRAAYCFRKS